MSDVMIQHVQAAQTLYPDQHSPAASATPTGISQPPAMAAALASLFGDNHGGESPAPTTYAQVIAKKMKEETELYHKLVDKVVGPDRDVRLEVGGHLAVVSFRARAPHRDIPSRAVRALCFIFTCLLNA